MDENVDNNNKILDNDIDTESFEFKYNFVNTPWDDRSKKSKFGIVVLLITIFVVTMACVINNFIMHYREFETPANTSNIEINCYRVRIEDYPFVARIHSASKELLCVAAVVSGTSILANGVCVKSGPIRVQLGNPSLPLCKKGVSVDVIETVFHDGIISKKLALLSSYDDIKKCSSAISIGTNIDWDAKVFIIGRPLNLGRSLSRQHVTLVKKDSLPKRFAIKNLKLDSMICVKDLPRCPVRAGDLLVQNDFLYGIAATSVYRTEDNNIACFADMNALNVHKELEGLDAEITL